MYTVLGPNKIICIEMSAKPWKDLDSKQIAKSKYSPKFFINFLVLSHKTAIMFLRAPGKIHML